MRVMTTNSPAEGHRRLLHIWNRGEQKGVGRYMVLCGRIYRKGELAKDFHHDQSMG